MIVNQEPSFSGNTDMAIVKNAHASLEAIDFQKDTSLFDKLSLCFGRLKGTNHPTERDEIINEASAYILRRTGLRIKIMIDPRMIENAYASIAPLTKDHPLWNDGYRNRLRAFSITDITEEKVMDGKIDLKNSKVSGYFSTVETKIVMFSGFLSPKYTPEEFTAVFLHELGHVFTFYEMTGKLAVTNLVLQETANTFSNNTDKTIRIRLLTEVEQKFGHKFEDKEKVAETNSVEAAIMIVNAAAMDWVRSEMGYKYYDGRTSEFMADQFATRHGAGRHLVTALDKASRGPYGNYGEYMTTSKIVTSNLLSFLGAMVTFGIKFSGGVVTMVSVGLTLNPLTILSNLIFGVMFRLVLLMVANTGDASRSRYTYDKPEARYAAIRRELITALKDPSVDKNFATEQLRSIETIDEHIANLAKIHKVTQQLANFLYDYLNGSYKEQKFQRQYEELANNELFVRAAQLKNLG